MIDGGSVQHPAPDDGASTPQAAREVVVVLLGELDIGTAPYAQSQVRRGLAQQPERLAVDLSNVTFMGSLGVLVYAREEAERAGVRLKLTGVQSNRAVRRTLEVSGLSELFDVG